MYQNDRTINITVWDPGRMSWLKLCKLQYNRVHQVYQFHQNSLPSLPYGLHRRMSLCHKLTLKTVHKEENRDQIRRNKYEIEWSYVTLKYKSKPSEFQNNQLQVKGSSPHINCMTMHIEVKIKFQINGTWFFSQIVWTNENLTTKTKF